MYKVDKDATLLPARVKGPVYESGADMRTHNTFKTPNTIEPAEFKDARLTAGTIMATLPPKSVVVLEIK
jgi:alpha-L-arabinofuranosidase